AGLVDGALRAVVWRPIEGAALEGAALEGAALEGAALDVRAGRQAGAPPWEVIAAVAGSLHRLEGAAWADLVPGHATRRDHARAALAVFDGAEDPDLRAARAWAEAHLPPETPSSLLHGDLGI